ncbi:MAG: hypothetical protein ACTSU5_02650 [Promethearchaeota archaeon]
MKFADLSPEAIDKIKEYEYDYILEKHEGPSRWEWFLKHNDPEFTECDGRWVLIPQYDEWRPNLSVVRCIPSADGDALTIFLRDTTLDDDYPHMNARVAVCVRVPGEEFFITILYHEATLIEEFSTLGRGGGSLRRGRK